MISILTLTLSLILILLWYYQRAKRMTILSRNGIPGPKPDFIFGNMREYNTKGYSECFEQWKKKYGRIFGYYLGAKPFIVVTDPELLKIIQIKSFDHFFHRPYVVPDGIYRNWKFHQQVNRVNPFKWRIMRTIMSRWFSSSQLRSMVPTINACIQEMMQKLHIIAQNNQEFNICELIEKLTMDIINRCAFGIQTDIQSKTTNILLESSRGVLSAKTSEFLASILLCFPEFSSVINFVRDIVEKIYDYFGLEVHGLQWNAVKNIVENRIKNNDNNTNDRKDMLQLMIDSREDSNKLRQFNTENASSKTLTDIEIIANLIAINEASYESPANNLSFVIHNLLNNPEIQQKVTEEIDNLYNEDGDINYNATTKLPLTEAVILETFRIFPTDPLFISHASDIDFKYGSFTIPKGADIRVPTYQLHHDDEFWCEPKIFNPYRFLGTDNQKDISPLVFQPFGVGPRLCPGKRFSILEIKLILANILHKYTLVPGVNTEIGDIQLYFKLFSLSPKNGVFVKLVPRVIS